MVNTESGKTELKVFFAENYWFLFNDGFTGGLSLHRPNVLYFGNNGNLLILVGGKGKLL